MKEQEPIDFSEVTPLDNHEQVNHPSHYNQNGIETIEMMKRIWGKEAVILWMRMCAFKYRARAGYKNNTNQDIAKAIWFEKEANMLETYASKSNRE